MLLYSSPKFSIIGKNRDFQATSSNLCAPSEHRKYLFILPESLCGCSIFNNYMFIVSYYFFSNLEKDDSFCFEDDSSNQEVPS